MNDFHKMIEFHFADIETQYARDKQLKREDVAKLDKWQRIQPHLPPPLHPIETALFLHSCYYSNEAAKKCIDLYYTCRIYCPEFLKDLDPFSPELQLAMDTWSMIVLPDLTPEGYMVMYMSLDDPNPDVFNFNAALKIADMAFALELKKRGCCNGHVRIFDIRNAKMAHFLKISLISAKKFSYYVQNALPIRLKSLHFVNCVPFVDKFMALIKPFSKKEIQNVLHTHFGDNSTIFTYVPKDILPIECGGLKLCATDYFKNFTRKDIERHAEYFKQEESRVADESKRPRQSTTHSEVWGLQGTFKNFDID